jgi:hypothetical protein
MLIITIPAGNSFYSLYADGPYKGKTRLKDSGETLLSYPPGALIFLYYTYPTHREACAVRNSSAGDQVSLPGLSKKVSLLFRVQASRVDKLRRAAGFLNTNSGGAYSAGDGFYVRLFFILCRRGKINYPALRKLAGHSLPKETDHADSH